MCENIDRCDICQKGIKAPARKLKLSKIPEKPWTHLCYDSKLKVLSNETTLVLSNTRELDRVPNTK